MRDDEKLVVIQADRDAAALLFAEMGGTATGCDMMRAGEADLAPAVQAFARHRLNTRAPASADVAGLVARLRELLARATPGPWAYRPAEFDDWGMIQCAPDDQGREWVVANSRAGSPIWSLPDAAHRTAGTDPYEPNGRLITEAVNALPTLLAALEALSPSGVEAGYVVVPREPTEAMLRAGVDNLFGAANDDWSVDARQIWSAMLAASQEGGREG